MKLASPQVVWTLTGYEGGALPPVGHRKPIRTFIDPKVMAFKRVYGGEGALNALLEIDPKDIKRINRAEIVDISKE